MREYTIKRITGTPDWRTVPCLDVDNYQWLPKLDIRMQAQLCCSDAGIHVHLRAWEKNIRAVHDQPLSQVCEDSCMEFFFRPLPDQMQYFNFEMNPIGQSYIGFGLNRSTRARLIFKDEDQLLQKLCRRCDGGWEVFYTIPLELITGLVPAFTLEAGSILYANLYKCGDLTEQPHFLSWNPVETDTPNFHRPDFFGKMILE